MKIGRVFLIAMMVGSLAVIGCGSDDGDGNGNGNGNGGTPDPTVECNEGRCANDSTLRAQCQTAVQECLDTEPEVNWDECIIGVVGSICGLEPL